MWLCSTVEGQHQHPLDALPSSFLSMFYRYFHSHCTDYVLSIMPHLSELRCATHFLFIITTLLKPRIYEYTNIIYFLISVFLVLCGFILSLYLCLSVYVYVHVCT